MDKNEQLEKLEDQLEVAARMARNYPDRPEYSRRVKQIQNKIRKLRNRK